MDAEAPAVERRATTPEKPVAPTTTTQQDLTFAGQRRVNLVWEFTQAFLALVVTLANVSTAMYMVAHRIPFTEYPPILSHCLFLIIGAYFNRTNHAAIGGVGPKPEQQYEGR